MKNKTVILCCGKKACPTLTQNPESDLFTLKDDFGGVVNLREEELDKISDALIELKEKNSDAPRKNSSSSS